MYKKILLPLDLTDRHEAALQSAVQLARHSNGEVILLHVIELIPGLERENEVDFYKRLETKARAHLGRVGATLTKEQIHWRPEVIFGNRAMDAAGFAEEQHADLIILTSPRFRPEHPASSLGSMTWRISFIAPCPVLLVKNA
jgi:nucleotide-binding universal stress UspA family protein